MYGNYLKENPRVATALWETVKRLPAMYAFEYEHAGSGQNIPKRIRKFMKEHPQIAKKILNAVKKHKGSGSAVGAGKKLK